MDPEVGASAPETQLKSVVLPEPLGPMRPRISPCRTSNETSSRAVKPPKCFASKETVSTRPIHWAPEGAAAPPRPPEPGCRRYCSASGDDRGRSTAGLTCASDVG